MVLPYHKFFVLFLIILLIGSLFFYTGKVNAAGSCTATVSPSSVQANSANSFTFSITNTGSGSITFIELQTPSSNFTFGFGSVSGWSVSGNSSLKEIYGGTLASGGTLSFSYNISAGSSEASSANWQLQTNDGTGAVSCTGSLGTAISGVADVVPPELSETITVSDVSSSSVKISWTTNEAATSVVNYGTTSDYGSTATDTALVTSHSITLTGLTANTTYYYYISSADGSGNNTNSEEETFVTAATGTTSTTTTTTTTSSSTTTSTSTPTKTPTPTPKPVDKTAPSVALLTDFSKPFKEAPLISGKAFDDGAVNVGVASVEYSIDNGKNWLPVDEIKDKGAKSTIFDFTPAIFEDGNYQVKVRAKDSSGNVGYSLVKTMVVDRLPPQVGGTLFSIGPQILLPNQDGIIFTLAGLEEKINLSAIGGPVEIELLSNLDHLSNLNKNSDNGLWSGILNFIGPGVYELMAKSVDGASNKTEKSLNRVVVLESGVIKDEKGSAVKDAQVSLYYLEPSTNQFVLWDGASFAQENPQKTNEQGKYKLLIPPGRYYLQISAKGYKTLKTNIFTTNQTLPVNTNFTIKPFVGFQIGPFKFGWPSMQESVEVELALPTLSEIDRVSLIGKEIPFFSFQNNTSEISINNLKGKPVVITFLSIWSPQTFEQLPLLDQLMVNKEVNSLVIMSQDTQSRASIFKKIGGYKVPIVADPDGTLIQPLGIINLPTHVFLDRKGVIRKTKVGVLTKDELLENLVN